MIKQSVLNSFKRVGINPENHTGQRTAVNRFTGEEAFTTALVAECIRWAYREGERGIENGTVRMDDFDRIRYFVLAEDKNAWRVCLD